MKRELMKQKKIIARYSSDNRLKSRIYKRLNKLNTKRTNNPTNPWADAWSI
jgi:hypothetical protein